MQGRWGKPETEFVRGLANVNTKKSTLSYVKQFQDWQASKDGCSDETPIEQLERSVLICRLRRYAQQVGLPDPFPHCPIY